MSDIVLPYEMDPENITLRLENVIRTGGGGDNIHTDTTAHWNAQRELIGQLNHIYVYSDYYTDPETGDFIPGIKVGDGNAYLIDTPFIATSDPRLDAHMDDDVRHVTAADRSKWDNKVTCFISQADPENLVFSKD